MQDPPKFTQFGIFGLKTNHLATRIGWSKSVMSRPEAFVRWRQKEVWQVQRFPANWKLIKSLRKIPPCLKQRKQRSTCTCMWRRCNWAWVLPGLPDFLDKIPKWGKCNKWQKIQYQIVIKIKQMTTKYIYQMVENVIKFYHHKAFQNIPNFFVRKYTIWQPCLFNW
jgi:hypothetical protein